MQRYFVEIYAQDLSLIKTATKQPQLWLINAAQTVLCTANCVEFACDRLGIDAYVRLVISQKFKVESQYLSVDQ